MMTNRLTFISGAALLGLALLAGSVGNSKHQYLVWNASPSLPIGFYAVRNNAPRPDDIVLVSLPDWVCLIADSRGYLPSGIPALKRIAALKGDVVCRIGDVIFINGKRMVNALGRDAFRRRMPVWSGCKTLQSGDVFLLADHPKSFDGRYFGVTPLSGILAVVTPLWLLSR